MRVFSSKIIEDHYTDASCGGYEEMLTTLTMIIIRYEEQLTVDDYYFIFGKLSFCYHYTEWDEDIQYSVPYRNNHYMEWLSVIELTDTMDEIWNQLLTGQDRPADFRYFGYRSDLRALCRITR